MALNINGRMKVKTLRADFKKEFGLTLRIYDGRSFADDDSTLAAIRKGDSKGGEFAPRKNTKVGNLEDKIMDMFGIKTQVAGSDDSYLCDNDLTLTGALEADQKKLSRKAAQQDNTLDSIIQEAISTTDLEPNEDEMQSLLDDFNAMFFSSAPKTEEEIDQLETIDLSEVTSLEADERLPYLKLLAQSCNLKTILVSDRIWISTYDNFSGELPVDMLDDLIQSGINIDFKEKKGGYLLFDLKYGVGESWGSDRQRENSFPFTELGLIKNFSDLLDIYKNPQEFIDKLDGEDLYGLFKKIADDIGEECGFDGDEYLEITGLYGEDEDHCIWRSGADNEDVRGDLAGDSITPVSVLEKLAEDANEEVRWNVAENPNTPVAILEKLAGDKEKQVRSYVVGNPNTPISILEKLAGDANEEVRSAVAENPNTPVALLEKLAGDEDEDVRAGVALSSNTPVALLEKLASGEVGWVVRKVAGNPNTPVAILEKLAGDKDEGVRSGVARNVNTPIAILEKLAGDANEKVRSAVAENPNTPVALLEKLAGDKEEWVRRLVAGNPNTPVAILEKLAGDKEEYVRRRVAGNPNTPVPMLEKLAGDEEDNVRGAVAGNSNTPVVLLEKLAGDKEEWVRRLVAGNPNTPVAILEKLAGDKEEYVRRRVAGNPNTPVPMLEKLAGNEEWRVRVGVALSSNTPVAILEKLAGDESEEVRMRVAKNPNAK